MVKRLTGLVFILFVLNTSMAQHYDMYEYKSFVVNNDTLQYRIMYPEGFERSKKYPLILFLHGAGERGSDNRKQLTHGATFFASAENRKNFPAFVIFPQCPENSYWANVKITTNADGNRNFAFNPAGKPTTPMRLTMQLLKDILKNPGIDKTRVYVGGLSMGGMGTFELLFRKPKIFAAAFPICGGGNPEMINRKAVATKIWAFHGSEDEIVATDYSVKMIEAYRKAGMDAKLTIYAGVGHNSWENVFAEPELLSWLFQNQL